MMYQIQSEDRVQKTWIPEGTEEYKSFKHVTQENEFLADFLSKKFKLKSGEIVLDVGGREGDIVTKLQGPEYIHLVDPDPTLKLSFSPGKFYQDKIQNLDLSGNKYKLIICSHVLGYLGNQSVQDIVFRNLVTLLDQQGTLVLFYNTNTGYMEDLLKFSKNNLTHGHYDYFNEQLFDELDKEKFSITYHDVSFDLNYSSYEELARCCWFLFGAMDQNIDGVSAQFLPKLKADLVEPTFTIRERVVLITKK